MLIIYHKGQRKSTTILIILHFLFLIPHDAGFLRLPYNFQSAINCIQRVRFCEVARLPDMTLTRSWQRRKALNWTFAEGQGQAHLPAALKALLAVCKFERYISALFRRRSFFIVFMAHIFLSAWMRWLIFQKETFHRKTFLPGMYPSNLFLITISDSSSE
jgi:hypothetical protein